MCLDINGIICSLIPKSVKDKDDKSIILCSSNNIQFIARPGLDDLLYLINTTFDIMFYTSRTEKNANDILQKLGESSDTIKGLYDIDGNNLLHQSNCRKLTKTKFIKDVNVVCENMQDANDNKYDLNDILMIDDSPEKFDTLHNHVIVFKTLTFNQKDTELLCIEQHQFMKCLINNINQRNNKESA